MKIKNKTLKVFGILLVLLAGISLVSADPDDWGNMMNGNWMMGGSYAGMWIWSILGAIIGILFVVGLVLGIIWLVRQLEKDNRQNRNGRK